MMTLMTMMFLAMPVELGLPCAVADLVQDGEGGGEKKPPPKQEGDGGEKKPPVKKDGENKQPPAGKDGEGGKEKKAPPRKEGGEGDAKNRERADRRPAGKKEGEGDAGKREAAQATPEKPAAIDPKVVSPTEKPPDFTGRVVGVFSDGELTLVTVRTAGSKPGEVSIELDGRSKVSFREFAAEPKKPSTGMVVYAWLRAGSKETVDEARFAPGPAK
jgi:hypothetical protein